MGLLCTSLLSCCVADSLVSVQADVPLPGIFMIICVGCTDQLAR